MVGSAHHTIIKIKYYLTLGTVKHMPEDNIKLAIEAITMI
jgi:hypothetical protein